MKYVVMHDREGRIAGLIASPDEAPSCIGNLAGYLSTEVGVPSDFPDLTRVETEEQLFEMLRGFRVDVSGARLVKNDS